MTPDDDATLTRLVRTHERAAKKEEDARYALYVFIQREMGEAKWGTKEALVAELMAKTGWGRARIFGIAAGEWSRDPAKNPLDKSTALDL